MGGYFVNYFNRFGRQWQVYVQAEGKYRTRAENLGLFFVRNKDGEMVPLSALPRPKPSPDRNSPCATTFIALPRSMAQRRLVTVPRKRLKAMEEVFAQTMPTEMGFAYMGMSFQEQRAQQGVPPAAIFALSLLFVFLILAALYESWSAALQRFAWHARSPCSALSRRCGPVRW